MRSELVTITPELADDLLKRNTLNRRISPTRVATLAATIHAGRWQVNGETIIVSKSGRLLDGQHRLEAVRQSGQPIKTWMVFDAPDEGYETIDTGRTRTTGDTLTIKGIPNASYVSSSAAHIWRLFHGQPIFLTPPTPYSLEIIDRYPMIVDLARKWAASQDLRRTIPAAPYIAAMVYLLAVAKREDLASDLTDGLALGAGLEVGNPILALRNRLLNLRGTGTTLRLASVWPTIVRALNALENGEEVRRILAPSSAGPVETPEHFAAHAAKLTDRERLTDLEPPASAISETVRYAERVKRGDVDRRTGRAYGSGRQTTGFEATAS